jgi:hypothetical protein
LALSKPLPPLSYSKVFCSVSSSIVLTRRQVSQSPHVSIAWRNGFNSTQAIRGDWLLTRNYRLEKTFSNLLSMDNELLHKLYTTKIPTTGISFTCSFTYWHSLSYAGMMLQMYMSRSPRVCDCSFRLCTLLFSSLLFWIFRPVHSYRTI